MCAWTEAHFGRLRPRGPAPTAHAGGRPTGLASPGSQVGYQLGVTPAQSERNRCWTKLHSRGPKRRGNRCNTGLAKPQTRLQNANAPSALGRIRTCDKPLWEVLAAHFRSRRLTCNNTESGLLTVGLVASVVVAISGCLTVLWRFARNLRGTGSACLDCRLSTAAVVEASQAQCREGRVAALLQVAISLDVRTDLANRRGDTMFALALTPWCFSN